MANPGRQYECIVFGATGYTGKYTAEHITTHLPTDFKWAIAGRSESKLKSLAADLKALNPDRAQPGIETSTLRKNELLSLARKTKVLVTTVGPYHLYGSAVFAACAETGTHYLDVTGEGPWVFDMVQAHHETARRTGAIMIPQNGVESAPADLASWLLATHIRKTLGVGTGEVINMLHGIKGGASGGTLTTMLTLFDSYGIMALAEKSKPWALCPIAPPKSQPGRPLLEKVFGLRTIPALGPATVNPMALPDLPIVQRSWGLHDGGKLYGPRFHVSGYMSVRNALSAFEIHLASTLAMLLLFVPPVRWILKSFIYKPGDGPTKEQTQNNYVEWRSTAEAEVDDPSDPKRAYLRMRWDGSMYQLTGVFLAEAALVLAREKTLANEIGGGVLTPSTLGEPYVERLKKAGLQIEVKTLP